MLYVYFVIKYVEDYKSIFIFLNFLDVFFCGIIFVYE